MKNIAVALTNRTNYSKLKPVLFELRRRSDVQCRIVLSSTIILDRYGNSYQDLLRDGLEIDHRIDTSMLNDSHEAMAKTVGLSVIEHATYFQRTKPDLVIIVGDRFDMLAPAISASIMNIPIAHIQGGELSGTIDNVIRDVITRVASLHFVATERSAVNLVRQGARQDRVFNFGCPAVEYISKLDVGDRFDKKRLGKEFKIDIDIAPDEKYFLVMIHPDTTNRYDVNMDAVLDAVESFGLKTFIFYPNVDANNSGIVSSIARYKRNENFYMIRHMPLEGFIHTLAHSVCMISNSSSGIREAASFGVPVINIGSRQADRERNKNVIDIFDRYDELKACIGKYMECRFDIENIYLKRDCAARIAQAIIDYLDSSRVLDDR
jgi:UDP-hydrolysing UDP-N-acetyl-D-glucosamine 2-epimerase